MKKLIKNVYYAIFLVFGTVFAFNFFLLIAYNGLGSLFTYKLADSYIIKGDTAQNPVKFIYEYSINGKKIEGKQTAFIETILLIDKTPLSVSYNTTFNNLSIINELKGRETKAWEQTVKLIIIGIPLLIFILIYKFANFEKWISIYSGQEYVKNKKNKA